MEEEIHNDDIVEGQSSDDKSGAFKTVQLTGMYENWFLDYASYVILERAVPELLDGLKPVHRRILHAMRQMDDGRSHKVANIIGQTMQYHPHGDASIGDALVQIGQKDLLIDTQGNWGNILTGDSAAAARYIEARLSKFSLEVLFNPKTTLWKTSYDGRKQEPVFLPVKFPLLLVMGVEGIAVGLASKILPHNFIELIDASIAVLEGREFEIYPDFPTGGSVDISKYNDGLRGGKIRIRARIQQYDKKTLIIKEIPFTSNTSSLIDSIISANERGKIKIRKIDDNTAENVEILIHLAPGVSPDTTIDALYAFTDCEVSISPNNCVIYEGKPQFLGASAMLKISTYNTLELVKRELGIRLSELREAWHFSSLEKIFIEKKIYRRIENSETWESVIEEIDKGLRPHIKKFLRKPTRDDILRLTEIKIKRISKYDSDKAGEQLVSLEKEIEEVNFNLEHLTEYAIAYFKRIRDKYGKGKERKTELRNFETIEAKSVAAANLRLYINREDGFAGTGLKKDEFVCECSDIDDIVIFRADGSCVVIKVAEKVFVGKSVIHIDVFKKSDDRTIYNMVYQDGRSGPARVKRFAVLGVTRDKEYDLTAGKNGSRILWFTVNPNGEAEIIKVQLRPKPRLKKLSFDFDFSSIEIKGRQSKGNLLSKNIVRKITQKEEGVSTLGAIEIWYDDTVKRLNSDGRGRIVGKFKSNDLILTITKSGKFKLYNYDLSNHFEEDMISIGKFDPEKILSVVYVEGGTGLHYVKRFTIEKTDRLSSFIGDHKDAVLIEFSFDDKPQLELESKKKTKSRDKVSETIDLSEFIGVKSYKAKGKRLTPNDVLEIRLVATFELETDPIDDKEEAQAEEDVATQAAAEPGEGEKVLDLTSKKIKPEKPEEGKTNPVERENSKGNIVSDNKDSSTEDEEDPDEADQLSLF